MEYNIIYEGRGYELPKYSIKVAEKIEKLEDAKGSNINFKEKCKLIYGFIDFALGKEFTAEVLGDFQEADPNTINIVYLEIVKQYNKPLTDYNNAESTAKLDEAGIDRLTDLLKSIPKVAELEKYKAIK